MHHPRFENVRLKISFASSTDSSIAVVVGMTRTLTWLSGGEPDTRDQARAKVDQCRPWSWLARIRIKHASPPLMAAS